MVVLLRIKYEIPAYQSIVIILIDGFPGIGKCEVGAFTACHPSIVRQWYHTAISIECMDAERHGIALVPVSVVVMIQQEDAVSYGVFILRDHTMMPHETLYLPGYVIKALFKVNAFDGLHCIDVHEFSLPV